MDTDNPNETDETNENNETIETNEANESKIQLDANNTENINENSNNDKPQENNTNDDHKQPENTQGSDTNDDHKQEEIQENTQESNTNGIAQESTPPQNTNTELEVGDYVELADGIRGIVQFIGPTEFAKGELVGLQMLTYDSDGEDGTKNDKTYFECQPGYAHWTRTEKIKTHSKTAPTPPPQQSSSPPPQEPQSYVERFSSVSDWKIPTELLEEAKRLDQDSDSDDLIDTQRHPDNLAVAVHIGDRVITVSGHSGIVRYIGVAHFSHSHDTVTDIVGIELDKWTPAGHDGTVQGYTYFTCTQGRGYFVAATGIASNLGATMAKRRKSSILMNAHMLPKAVWADMSDLKADGHRLELSNIQRQMQKIEKKLLEISVLQQQQKQGDVLDSAQLTKIDRRKHLKQKLDALTQSLLELNPSVQGVTAPLPQINFNVGDVVKLERGKTGVVRFVGETEFASGEVIGLELDTWTPAGHNGSVRGKCYFEAQEGRGYFTRRSNILNVVLPLVAPLRKRRMSVKYKLNPLYVGDRVRMQTEDTRNGRAGVVRYIGYPSFTDGEVVGLELDEWCMNAHNGLVDGVQVFVCSTPGRGIFLRRDEVEKYDPLKEKLKEIIKNLKLGDTVCLSNNRKGHVKYIGPVTGYDEMIGVELEAWSPQAKDGRYDGFRYFTAPDGRGIFIKRSTIMDVIPLEAIPQIEDDKYDEEDTGTEIDDDAQDSTVTPVVGNRVKLSKGRFGVIHSIDEMDDGSLEYAIDISQLISRTLLGGKHTVDIAHKRQHSMAGAYKKAPDKQSQSARQSGLLDIEDLHGGKVLMGGGGEDDSDNYDSDDDNYTALGETIELRSGKIGTIRFIGVVHFAKGNWIGVELHDHFGPHDGAVRGVRYFTCPAKRGIFVKQIKGRKKDDPTRQHLKRRCPECYGEFVKKRDPRAAYKSVGIVCDGCNKHGNEYSSTDWYFQCGQCEQTDFCIKCMLKLPIVDSDDLLDSYHNIRAKVKPIGSEWIFEDIHAGDGSDSEDEYEHKISISERRNSKFQHAPIKSIFDHFDADSDGKLSEKDVDDLYTASRNELDKKLFSTPMKYQSFEQCWKEITPSAAQNILEFIAIAVNAENVKQSKMKNDKGDSIDLLEKVRDVFNYFDADTDGILGGKDISKMMALIDKLDGKKLAFDVPCDYIQFMSVVQSSSSALITHNMFDKILRFIELKIEDVFHTFCHSFSQKMNEIEIKTMYIESCACESAWRGKFVIGALGCDLESFVASWFRIEVDEQHCILNETAKRINRRLMGIFNYFDRSDQGTLDNQQILEILQLIDMQSSYGHNKYFNMNHTPLSFDSFRSGVNLLNKCITVHILPNLEDYVRRQQAKREQEQQAVLTVDGKSEEKEKEKRKEEKVVPVAVVSEEEKEVTDNIIVDEEETEDYRQKWVKEKLFVNKLIDELQAVKAKEPISEKCVDKFTHLIQFFDVVMDDNQERNNNKLLQEKNKELVGALVVLQTELDRNTQERKKQELELKSERQKSQELQTGNREFESLDGLKRELANMKLLDIEREKELKQEREKIVMLQQELDLNNNRYNMSRKTMEEEMEEMSRKTESESVKLNELNELNSSYRQELTNKNAEIEQYKNQTETEKEEKKNENSIIQQYVEKEKTSNALIHSLEAKNNKFEQEIDTLKENENELMGQVQDLRNSKYRLINSTSAEIDALRHKIKMYTNRNWNGLISAGPK